MGDHAVARRSSPWIMRGIVFSSLWLFGVSVGRLCSKELRSALRPESWLVDEAQSCARRFAAEVQVFAPTIAPFWEAIKFVVDTVVLILRLYFAFGVWTARSLSSASGAFLVASKLMVVPFSSLSMLIDRQRMEYFGSEIHAALVGIYVASSAAPIAMLTIAGFVTLGSFVLARILGGWRKGLCLSLSGAALLWRITPPTNLLKVEEEILEGLSGIRTTINILMSEPSLEAAALLIDSPTTALWVFSSVMLIVTLRFAALLALSLLCSMQRAARSCAQRAMEAVRKAFAEEEDEEEDGILDDVSPESGSSMAGRPQGHRICLRLQVQGHEEAGSSPAKLRAQGKPGQTSSDGTTKPKAGAHDQKPQRGLMFFDDDKENAGNANAGMGHGFGYKQAVEENNSQNDCAPELSGGISLDKSFGVFDNMQPLRGSPSSNASRFGTESVYVKVPSRVGEGAVKEGVPDDGLRMPREERLFESSIEEDSATNLEQSNEPHLCRPSDPHLQERQGQNVVSAVAGGEAMPEKGVSGERNLMNSFWIGGGGFLCGAFVVRLHPIRWHFVLSCCSCAEEIGFGVADWIRDDICISSLLHIGRRNLLTMIEEAFSRREAIV